MGDQNINQEQAKELLKDTVRKVVSFMDLECQIEVREEEQDNGKALFVSVFAPYDGRFLIGKDGQNLRAFEHIVRAMYLKKTGEFKSIIMDVNDYRKSRTNYLVELAKQAVTRVRNTQKAEALLPMSAYERRVVHMELAMCPDIATESIGSEPQRRVVIKPYP